MFLPCTLVSPSLLTTTKGVTAMVLRPCRFSRARCGSLSFTSTEPAESGPVPTTPTTARTATARKARAAEPARPTRRQGGAEGLERWFMMRLLGERRPGRAAAGRRWAAAESRQAAAGWAGGRAREECARRDCRGCPEQWRVRVERWTAQGRRQGREDWPRA